MKLTELEGDVLGFVWKLGPVTTYRVRRVFADSPSSHWRASAGSIYPVVDRLLGNGLIRSKEKKQKSRTSLLLTLTPKGKRELIAWVAPEDVREAAAFAHDPIRTRVHFLGLLPPAERRAFLARVEALVMEQIRTYEGLESEAKKEQDTWDEVVLRGARGFQAARLRWVRWMLNVR